MLFTGVACEMSSRSVIIAFVDAKSPALAEHFLNRGAIRLAPPIPGTRVDPKVHCEIIFPESGETGEDYVGYACSIVWNGEVFMRRKRFSRRDWTFRVLPPVSSTLFDEMRRFATACRGDRFNHVGYGLYALSGGTLRVSGEWSARFKPMTRRWFCSEIVLEILKYGGFVPRDISSVQHPETVYQMLETTTAPTARKVSTALNFN